MTHTLWVEMKSALCERSTERFMSAYRAADESAALSADVLAAIAEEALHVFENRLSAEERALLKDRSPTSQPSAAPVARPRAPRRQEPVIELKRVLQVTRLVPRCFDASDAIGLTRTVFRSPQERTFFEAVRLFYPGLLALPNYPLSAVVNLDWLRLVVPPKTYVYGLRCLLDAVLVTPREGDPVAAFELDSGHHDTPLVLHRDRMKNELLSRAGLRLFRLRVEESVTMTVDDWYAILADQVGELPMPTRLRTREHALTLVPVS